MTYVPTLHPVRDMISEKTQPITRKDVELVRRVLDSADELVIVTGNAKKSHEPHFLMTAGERVDVIDYTLKSQGVDPNRYCIIPVENFEESNAEWASEIMALTPRWDTFWTRNFKNDSIVTAFCASRGRSVHAIDEQKPIIDYYELLARVVAGDSSAHSELNAHIHPETLERMQQLGMYQRADKIYNRKNVVEKVMPSNRALFLGGFQPFTGVFSDRVGHISNVQLGLQSCDQVVIAIGSAQKSLEDKDPLEAGKRIEAIRYVLMHNGIDASKFYTIPVRDVAANHTFAGNVISLCPSFNSVIAGNDWTKQLFGEGTYRVVPVPRTTIPHHGEQVPLSASLLRKTISDIIRVRHSKSDDLSQSTISQIRDATKYMLDPASQDILGALGFYDILKFLAFAKE